MIHKAIKGHENYLVSDTGKIYSLTSKRYIKAHDNGNGYLHICLGNGGRFYVHRLVAEAFLPNHHNLPEVDHIDRNRSNNDVKNLRWVTREGNLKNVSAERKKALKEHYRRISLMQAYGVVKKVNDEICIGYVGCGSKHCLDAATINYHYNKGLTHLTVKQGKFKGQKFFFEKKLNREGGL